MKSYKLDYDLLEMLRLNPRLSYDLSFIKRTLKQLLKDPNFIKDAHNRFPDLILCGCGKCDIQVLSLIRKILKKYLVKDQIPKCNYYEYDQIPVELISLDY